MTLFGVIIVQQKSSLSSASLAKLSESGQTGQRRICTEWQRVALDIRAFACPS